jgi:hypothetical protein
MTTASRAIRPITTNPAVSSVAGSITTLAAGGSAILVNASPTTFPRGFVGFLGRGDQNGIYEILIDGVSKYFDQTYTTHLVAQYLSDFVEYVGPGHNLQQKVTNNSSSSSNYYGTVIYL